MAEDKKNAAESAESRSLPAIGYKKSNVLIGAKYKSSLLENKIMGLGISMIQRNRYRDKGDELEVSFDASDLREILHGNSGSFYQQLEPAAAAMTSRNFGFTNPDNKSFHYWTLITDAKYENSVFSIHFNPSLREYLKDPQKNFTYINIGVTLTFRSNYTYRLYELLRSRAYHPKNSGIKGNVFSIEYGVSELKLSLGIVDASDPAVRKVLDSSVDPDYDEAVAVFHTEILKSWSDFRKVAIDPAVKEINKTPGTGMNVSYSTVRKGRGGVVKSVIFHVELEESPEKEILRYNVENGGLDTIITNQEEVLEAPFVTVEVEEPKKPERKRRKTGKAAEQEKPKTSVKGESKANNDDMDLSGFGSAQFIVLGSTMQLLAGEKMSQKDIMAICKAAEFDFSKIEKAYRIAQNTGDIKNLVGWMIKAIQDGYEEAPVKKKNTRKKKNDFHNFQEREYDYEDLEQKLVKKLNRKS